MINKKDFERLRKDMKVLDQNREKLINKSRHIVKLSKLIIYSSQRGDLMNARKNLAKIREEVKALKSMDASLSGSFKVAMQEYVEAVCFYEFIKNRKLPTSKELGVESNHYLLGICDLTGELVRFGVNSAIKKDFESAGKTKDFVEELYGELLKIDFRNSELRRKIDSVKWDLRKLEELLVTK
jgi:translin